MSGRIVAGLLVIALAVVLFLDARHVIPAGTVWDTYWPVILIIVGVSLIVSHPARPLGGLIVMVVGLGFLASRLDLLPSDWHVYLWPLVLLVLGFAILMGYSGRSRHRRMRPWGEPEAVDQDTVQIRSYFAGVQQVVRSANFTGGSIDVAFGGATLDLRQAQLAPTGARLDINASFGGVELFVPPTWRVVVNARPFLGGVNNRAVPPQPTAGPGPTLQIDAHATLGGVDIKN